MHIHSRPDTQEKRRERKRNRGSNNFSPLIGCRNWLRSFKVTGREKRAICWKEKIKGTHSFQIQRGREQKTCDDDDDVHLITNFKYYLLLNCTDETQGRMKRKYLFSPVKTWFFFDSCRWCDVCVFGPAVSFVIFKRPKESRIEKKRVKTICAKLLPNLTIIIM